MRWYDNARVSLKKYTYILCSKNSSHKKNLFEFWFLCKKRLAAEKGGIIYTFITLRIAAKNRCLKAVTNIIAIIF